MRTICSGNDEPDDDDDDNDDDDGVGGGVGGGDDDVSDDDVFSPQLEEPLVESVKDKMNTLAVAAVESGRRMAGGSAHSVHAWLR